MRIEYPRLPVAFMNDDHDHAANQIETMLAVLPSYPSSRAPLVQVCRAFLEHNRAHFAREEEAMRASGFPPYAVHHAEHERVLAWLENLIERIEAGLDFDSVKAAVENDVPTWLVQHIETMDRVTANWIATHQPASSMSV